MSFDIMRKRISNELNSLTEFWLKQNDERDGGIASVYATGKVDMDAPRTGTNVGRRLYGLSAAYRATGNESALKSADKVYKYMRDTMLDKEHGGTWQAVSVSGEVLAPEKRIYEQAFAIYALSEYYLAGGNTEALEQARNIYTVVEKARGEKRGWADFYSADWSEPTLSTYYKNKITPNERSLDSQSHILEAYTNLLRAWRDEGLRKRCTELVTLMCEDIFIPDTWRIGQVFDSSWNCISEDECFGDDLEVAWFINDALDTIGDDTLTQKYRPIALKLVDRGFIGGYDPINGGVIDRLSGGKMLDIKNWWGNCEASNGALMAYKATGKEAYLEMAEKVWEFIFGHFIRADGSWTSKVHIDGTQFDESELEKTNVCPYHTIRACVKAL